MSEKPKKAQIVLEGWGPTPSDVHRFLEEQGCFDAYNKLLAIDLLSMVSRKEQAIIHGDPVFTGWTCPVSIPGLARRNGMSKSKVYSCVKEMEDKGAIERRSPNNDALYQFRVMVYPPALEIHKQNPDRAKQYLETPIPDADERRKIQEEASRDYSDSELVHDVELKSNPSPHSGALLKVKDLQEPRPTVSDGLGTNEESEKRGGDINLEDKDSPKEKTVSPRSESRDVVPTTEIGKAKEVDKLVETIMGGKQSNTKPPEDGIEPFIDSFNNAFNLESVAVLSQAYVEPALALQKGISSKLSAAGLALPVNRFLEKYLVPCVHESLADGTLDELPRAFGFFLRKPKGKQVLDRSVGVAKSSNSVTQSVERTNTFLGGLKGREPVPESSKERVSDMIANIKPISADETKRLRRLRE